MGLGMIETMKIFDAERHAGIKMRVGIHTGETLRREKLFQVCYK
jgi:adenylate cyclase 9